MNQFIGYVLASTTRAILFQDHFWHQPEWFPRSQITVMPPEPDNTEFRFTASDWICQQKEVEEFQERGIPDA